MMCSPQLIREHNGDKTATSTLKANRFADLTAEEFAGMYGGGLHESNTYMRSHLVDPKLSSVDPSAVPSSVNWTAQGKVSAVR